MTSKVKLQKNLTFEKALARLNEIVGQLEEPDRGLEASLELFEEGIALSRFCRGKIDEIQGRVEMVLRETADGIETGPLPSGEEEGGDADGKG